MHMHCSTYSDDSRADSGESNLLLFVCHKANSLKVKHIGKSSQRSSFKKHLLNLTFLKSKLSAIKRLELNQTIEPIAAVTYRIQCKYLMYSQPLSKFHNPSETNAVFILNNRI